VPSALAVHRLDAPADDVESPRRITGALPVLLAVGAGLAYGAYVVVQFWQREGNWDSAVLGQAVADYSRLSAPVSETLGQGASQLGDHFSPVLAVLAPVYAIAPHTLTLLLAQVVLLAASVFVLSRAAVRHLGPMAGGLVGGAYALSFGLQSGVAQGFHELAFAVLLLAIVGDRYLLGRYTAAAAWCVPLLLVKEDMAFVVAAFGVVLVVRGARRLGAWLIAGSVVYVSVVLLVLIPALNTRNQYDFTAMAIDGSDGLAAGVAQLVLDMGEPIRWVAPVMSLLVVALICLRSPFSLLAVPIVLARVAAPWEYYWGPFGHYNMPVMTILFVAAIEGITRTRAADSPLVRGWSAATPFVTVALAVGLLPAFALGSLAGPGQWSRSPEAGAIEQLVEEIPDGSSVQADRSLASFLFPTTTTYTLDAPGAPRELGETDAPDYIAIDRRAWADETVDPLAYARSLHPDATYVVTFDEHGIVLLKRVADD
jgi:uncharacterized membrane protein